MNTLDQLSDSLQKCFYDEIRYRNPHYLTVEELPSQSHGFGFDCPKILRKYKRNNHKHRISKHCGGWLLTSPCGNYKEQYTSLNQVYKRLSEMQ